MSRIIFIFLLALFFIPVAAQAQGNESIEDRAQGVELFPDMEDPAQTLNIFFTTSCPYCEKLHNMVIEEKDFMRNERVQVNFVPVNGSAEEIISGDYEEVGNHFGEKGGSSDKVAKENHSVAQDLVEDGLGFPMLAWTNDDGESESHVGMPQPEQFRQAIEIVKHGEPQTKQ